eukprot:scaffold341782_cov88-Attheya_sp.AAC.1
MLGPSALFNTSYRHGANGDGKEPRLHGGRNVPREASKSKQCDDKATETAQTSVIESNHNTETA